MSYPTKPRGPRRTVLTIIAFLCFIVGAFWTYVGVAGWAASHDTTVQFVCGVGIIALGAVTLIVLRIQARR
jgi:hypothetical protein